MKAFASDKAVRLGAEGLVLWAELHNEGEVNVVVLKCHCGDHSKSSNFCLRGADFPATVKTCKHDLIGVCGFQI